MFAVALAMGGYAWWSHYQKGRQVLEFWGPDATNLIRHAAHVEVWLLSDPVSDGPKPASPLAADPEPGEPTPDPPAASTPGTSTPGTSTPGTSTPAASTPGTSTPGTSASEATESALSETLTVAGQPRRVAERRDISQVRGLVHARHALVVDTNYLWGESRGDCQADWAFALRFEDRGQQATLVFDRACARIRLLEQDKEVGIPRPLSDLIGQRQRTWASEGTAP